MRFGDLTYLEIKERASDGWLVVVPTGCTEQQGPHLPVDFDTWFVERVALAASEKATQDHGVHSLVLPALPFGPTPEHRNYGSGYIHIPVELHDELVHSVSLHRYCSTFDHKMFALTVFLILNKNRSIGKMRT